MSTPAFIALVTLLVLGILVLGYIALLALDSWLWVRHQRTRQPKRISVGMDAK